VDGANPSFIRALKDRLEEDTNYEQLISYLKKQSPSVYDLESLQQNMLFQYHLQDITEKCYHTAKNYLNTGMDMLLFILSLRS
jgi:hypothetical protein